MTETYHSSITDKLVGVVKLVEMESQKDQKKKSI